MSDAQLLKQFFDRVEHILYDGALEPDERREMLAYMLRHLVDLMGDACAAYDLWRRLMATITDRQITRH